MIKYSNLWIQTPNFYTLGTLNELRVRSGQSIYCDFDNYDNHTNNEKLLFENSIQPPECLKIISITNNINSKIITGVSLLYGRLSMTVFKENILINARLCLLVQIRNKLIQNNIECKYIGDKPFLSFTRNN